MVGAADAYYLDTSRLYRQAIAMVIRLWATVDVGDLSASWARSLPEAMSILVAAETVAAELADPYLTDVLGDGAILAPRVSPAGMIGSDGESLLYLPVIDAKRSIASGMAANLALDKAKLALSTYVHTAVADTARLAVTSGMTARPHVTGYYRVLRPPSCARCAILAGRFYRWNKGFRRHPRCFPAGVTVSGPKALASSRRWYEGELVVLATASGQQLSLTGNHPVLTSRGWVPANLLQEGDEVVRSTRPQGATALEVPDHDQVPTAIEDVWRSLGMLGFERMPTTTEDFHGDGQDGEVDVVYADRTLLSEGHIAVAQQVGEEFFSSRMGSTGLFDVEGSAELLKVGQPASPRGVVGRSGLGLPLFGCHASSSNETSGAAVTSLDAHVGQPTLDHVAADAVLTAQGVFADTAGVGGGDLVHGEVDLSARWDAPAGPFSGESRVAYAARGQDLLDRLTGQVELDRVVNLRRIQWEGHVYSLTSTEGWHSANGLIVSNCDCIHVPAMEAGDSSLLYDPRKAIAAGAVTGLSKADTKAILEYGANPSQVVNARQGMYDSGQFTTTGTTRQGVAGARMLAQEMDRALGLDVSSQTYTNVTLDRVAIARFAELFRRGKMFTQEAAGLDKRYAYRFASTPRPTPQMIVASVDSRAEAVRLLTNYGYLI